MNMNAVGASESAKPVFFDLEDKGHPDGHSTYLGFWIYLMSDCLIFAALFATFGVLGSSFAAGPAPKDLFDLNLVLLNTFMLLFSSITFGFAMISADRNQVTATRIWLAVTALFGLAFLGIELYEFHHLMELGATPQRSAFLSAFYALVGTHGLHVFFGLVWIIVLITQIGQHGLIGANRRRMMCLSMFWHFLDVVWIGVFTVVYLLGVIQ
ncbi:cytochrome o ubiquinol oxidase subunit III [Roseibium sp. RKSG952]|uniref:cytochrome o ubiquinol oxidase subunit III n=1 Tax=Roseibium sp. RKSG952 TaxID=2529384 RepID=UPI0012BC9B93|nr:cytochrome o ubiquinol oxidase subunit III [Roseibium sp. RKSG952]MTH95867.1 cytochrome o ubiquinol oxidase subunit III [Roseibium sp. RKSG952]